MRTERIYRNGTVSFSLPFFDGRFGDDFNSREHFFASGNNFPLFQLKSFFISSSVWPRPNFQCEHKLHAQLLCVVVRRSAGWNLNKCLPEPIKMRFQKVL